MNRLRRCTLAALTAALAAGLAVLPAASVAQGGPSLVLNPSIGEPKAESRTLTNGLTAIALDRPATGKFDAVMTCLAGYAFDPPGGSGTAHLVEHFLASPVVGLIGPPRELIDELTREYEKTGGQTSERTGQLEAEMAPWKAKGRWDIGTSADLVNYGVRNYPSAGVERYFAAAERTLRMVPKGNIENHRAGLLNELRELERNARHAMISANAVATYGDHPYGVATGGRIDDMKRVSLESLQQFVASYYSPDRCTVAVIGDVRSAAALELAERFLGAVPRKPAPPDMSRPARAAGERRVSVASVAGPRVLVNFLKPPIPSREDDVAEVVASLLSGDGAWSVQGDVVRRRRMATEAWCANGGSGQRADNMFTVGATPEPGIALEQLEAALVAQLDRLGSEIVAEEDLQAAIRRLLEKPILDGTDFSLAVGLARYQLTAGDWRALWEARESRSRVTSADVKAFAQKYLVPGKRTVVRLLPESK